MRGSLKEYIIRKINFSSFLKIIVLTHILLGILGGLLFFFISVVINVFEDPRIGNIMNTGIYAGIVFILFIPIYVGLQGFSAALLGYLPFNYWIQQYGLKILIETKESTSNIQFYDNIKQHYEDIYPYDVSVKQAYVHTGMYLGWAIEKELISKEFEGKNHSEIHKFRQKEITGAEIYRNLDGIFADSILNEEGNLFTTYYYVGDRSLYLQDYKDTFQEAETIYHVENSCENYMKLKEVVDKRFWEWKEQHHASKE